MKHYVEETESYYTPRQVIVNTQTTNAIGCMVFWCLHRPPALKYIKQRCKDPYRYKEKLEFQELLRIVPTFKQEDAAYVLTYFLGVIFDGNGEDYLNFIKRYHHELYLEISRSENDDTIYVLNTLSKDVNKLSEYENRRQLGFLLFAHVFDPANDVTVVWPTYDMVHYALEWQFEQVTEYIDINVNGTNKLPATKNGIKFKGKMQSESVLDAADEAIRLKLAATKMFLKHAQSPSINMDAETLQHLDAFNNDFDKSWAFYELPFDDTYDLLKRQLLVLQPLLGELNQLRTYYHQTDHRYFDAKLNKLANENQALMDVLKQANKDKQRFERIAEQKEKQVLDLHTKLAQVDRMERTIQEQDQWIEQLETQLNKQLATIQALEKQIPQTEATTVDIQSIVDTLSTQTVVLIGGNPNWQKKFIERVPATIIDIDIDFDEKLLANVDVVVFNTQIANHRIYAKVKKHLPESAQLIYINDSTNIERSLLEIGQQLK